MGRPSGYSPEIAAEICELIATTPRGIDAICSENDGLPSPRTVHRWLNEEEEFRQSYLRARERQADLLFDQCLEIADDGSNDTKLVGREGEEHEACNSEWISRSKLRVETRMRMAGKLAPKKYGEAVQLRHADAEGETIDLSATSAAARLAALMEAVRSRQAASPALLGSDAGQEDEPSD